MLYRVLLWLCFPRRTRREFGEEMARLCADQLRHARRSGGSVAAVWVDAIADAVVQGLSDRFALARRVAMNTVEPVRRWRWWMHALARDARYAVRILRRQPGATLLAVLTMALGIGANTAIFSAVDAVLLRPLPYDDPDRIVMVWEKRPAEGVLDNVVAPADFVDWARMNSSFETMAAQDLLPADLTGYGEPVRLPAGAVSPGFFEIFRVRPLLGRTFTAEEGVDGTHRVVILGHRLWQARFGSDREVVGRTIQLNGVAHEVVGVLPASFEFPDASIELWTPIPYEGTPQPLSRALHQIDVYARLKPGVSIEQARADMDRVAAVLSRQYPDTNENHGAHVVSLREQLAEPVESGLLLLFGAVGFVLLIACVNVANLLLANAAARRREMAIRAAVGAGRARLAGQALTESVVLGLAGGAAGVLVANWGIALVRGLAPQGLRVIGLERLGLDVRVLAFTFLLSIVTSVLFGMLPAWQAARQDANESLKDGGRSPAGVRRRLRVGLVISEIALASLLLVGAGLSLRSFYALLHAEPGIELENRLTAFVSLPASRYRDSERRVAAYQEIDGRFASIPGVRAVGAVNHLPLSGTNSRFSVSIEGREPVPDAPMRAHPRSVTPGYFSAIGMTVKTGRGFTERDAPGAPLVVIVNETMSRAYWPGESPIGQRVRLGGTEAWREVVGIVSDVRHDGLDRPPAPEVYMPHAQYVWSPLTFVLATDGDPAAFASAAREQLRAIDPALPLSNLRTMEEVAAQSVASQRSAMILLATFGVLALVLSAAGIFGVTAHLVALRTAEIGVRMTLGAHPRDLMRLVIREGTVQACIGLTIGLAGAVALMQWFRAMLFGVGPADPLTLAGVAVILLATTLLACLVPARRAMRVDPVQALRM
jgi:putative ABC transport system permease protein